MSESSCAACGPRTVPLPGGGQGRGAPYVVLAASRSTQAHVLIHEVLCMRSGYRLRPRPASVDQHAPPRPHTARTHKPVEVDPRGHRRAALAAAVPEDPAARVAVDDP